MTGIEIPTPEPRTLDEALRPFAEAVSARYAIKRLIGRGGMGMVFLARDRRLDRLVAIKTLPPELSKDVALRERFLRETRTAGAMAHPNIVPIHGADEVDGHVYFVMSYVEGESLAARVRAQGRLEAKVVAAILRDVAAALAHAHERGIVHRDIKAENILLQMPTDRALVTDFGIARLAEATPLTVTGQVLGTVYYVSPEQVTGDRVDSRSDLYSLGVVGFLALTGRFPFDADVASAVLVSHVTKNAPPIASVARDVPASLAAIIDRCLRKDPDHRFSSASELIAAIDAAGPGLDLPPAPTFISDTEAHAVWKRASELQARTGIEPRPEAVTRPRDAEKDRLRRAGLGLGDVRAAADEAGIAADYVDHALKEHGLMMGGRAAVEAPIVAKVSFWTKAPLDVIHETSVAGEIPSPHVERLINVVRDGTGTLGQTLAKTRELAWWTGGIGNRIDVSVVPRDGRTHVRVVQSARRTALLTMLPTFLAVALTVGPMVGVAVYEMIGGPEAEPFAILTGLAVGPWLGLKAGRWLLRRVQKGMVARIERLTAAIGAKVRESVDGK